jgi:hypothetical protein
MSIDARFSKDRFQMAVASDRSVRETRLLSDELQEEVLTILHEDVCKKVQQIVDLLNQQGHQLSPYYPPRPGDIAFRDDRCFEGTYECDLRLGVDVVISVGYRDTKAGFEESEDRPEDSSNGETA